MESPHRRRLLEDFSKTGAGFDPFDPFFKSSQYLVF